jgi:hypothetical protein
MPAAILFQSILFCSILFSYLAISCCLQFHSLEVHNQGLITHAHHSKFIIMDQSVYDSSSSWALSCFGCVHAACNILVGGLEWRDRLRCLGTGEPMIPKCILYNNRTWRLELNSHRSGLGPLSGCCEGDVRFSLRQVNFSTSGNTVSFWKRTLLRGRS